MGADIDEYIDKTQKLTRMARLPTHGMVALCAVVAERQNDRATLMKAIGSNALTLTETKACAPNPEHTAQLYMHAFKKAQKEAGARSPFWAAWPRS